MELAEWIAARRLRAVRRVNICAVCLAVLVLAAAVWLGAREAAMPARYALAERQVADQARLAAVDQMKRLSYVCFLAKVRAASLLRHITDRENSDDLCSTSGDLRALPGDDPCPARWRLSLERVWSAAFPAGGPPLDHTLLRDPWGAPFLLNEAEFICAKGLGWCPEDTLRSAGPDGRFPGKDDIVVSVPKHLYRDAT